MSPNDSREIKDMTGDMGCIYESLKEIKVSMIKKSDVKEFDSVAERKGESKKRNEGQKSLKFCKKKKVDERIKDLESLSKDIADGFNLDFEELGAKVNT